MLCFFWTLKSSCHCLNQTRHFQSGLHGRTVWEHVVVWGISNRTSKPQRRKWTLCRWNAHGSTTNRRLPMRPDQSVYYRCWMTFPSLSCHYLHSHSVCVSNTFTFDLPSSDLPITIHLKSTDLQASPPVRPSFVSGHLNCIVLGTEDAHVQLRPTGSCRFFSYMMQLHNTNDWSLVLSAETVTFFY